MQKDWSQIERKLNEIDVHLISLLQEGKLPKTDISLSSGLAGLCLYFMTRHQQTGNELHYESALSVMEMIVESLESVTIKTYCEGAAGIGWLIEYGLKSGFFDGDANEILEEFDEHFLSLMRQCFEVKCYDFLHGGLGYGYYFLHRSSLHNRQAIVSEAIRHLNDIAIKDGELAKWYHYDFDVRALVKGRCNLGLAHGVPSIVSFLCKAHSQGFEQPLAADLISRGTKFIIAQRLPKTSKSVFPYFSEENDHEHNHASSRLGWCYGDLSIAISIWKAAKVLDSDPLRDLVFELLDFSAKRRDLGETDIVDAGFCHGAAGLLHIYDWFYRETNKENYRDAAWYWAEQSLTFARFQDGLAGYKSYSSRLGWQNDFGLLEGIAGVGLSFGSFLDKNKSSWDEWLLIS